MAYIADSSVLERGAFIRTTVAELVRLIRGEG
jgi:hypothetical protein